jgi:two-component system LytT family response regulator
MIKINCIAIDDDALGQELVKNHILAIPYLNLVDICRNVHEAMDCLQDNRIDLIFTDIEMPDINGIQFLKSLSHPPMTVFITAFHQYALDAFNLNAVDYLLKPVSFDRFLMAANKALELFLSRKRMDFSYDLPKSVDSNPGYLFVTSDYSLVKIPLDDVTHIEGLKDYLKIYFTNQPNPVLTRMTMKAIEERLPPRKFFRVHKSYIVAIDKIEFIRSQRIKIGPHLVPISNSHYEVFRQKVNI